MKLQDLLPLASSVMLLVVLFLMNFLWKDSVPFSFGALTQPYEGENALISNVLLGISLLEVLMAALYFVPLAISNPNGRMVAFTAPQIIAVFGFVIGILNHNAWSALPFFAATLLLWVYASIRLP